MRRLVLLALLALPCFGAANMVISGLTVNTIGAYVATFSPCVSPMSLSAGTVVTGATPFNNGFAARTVESSSISGCTLTILTYAATTQTLPVFADDVSPVYLTIATTSNLQDAGGNTVSASATNTNFPSTANNSTWYEMAGTLGSTFIRVQGAPFVGSTATGSIQWMSTDGCYTFNATWTGSTGSFSTYIFNYNSGFIVFQDGVQLGGQTTATSDAGYSSYSTGGTLTGTHNYEVCSNLTGNSYQVMFGLRLVNGTFGAKPPAKKLMVVFGASEASCQGINDTTTCAWWMIARALGYSDQHMGNAGWPVTINTGCTAGNCNAQPATALINGGTYIVLTTGTTDFTLVGASSSAPGTLFTATGPGTGTGTAGNTYGNDNLRDCAKNPGGLCSPLWANYNMSTHPDLLLIIPGGNDAKDGTAFGTNTTPGTFSGDAVTLFSNIVATLSATAARIYIFDEYYAPAIGNLPCPSAAVQLPYETAWLGAGSFYGAAHPTQQVHPTSTFAPTCAFNSQAYWQGSTYPTDSLHLTPLGQQAWANIMLPFLTGAVSNPSIFGIAVQ